ncbi:JAB domain-containing protein [Paraflavisolibacter sp. H34]|uniref:JAB domain-containing protein n=1 Tax=Huijunlia imazamoxiresistens TaxID=3127457 RepID=UPI0030164AD3
MKKMLSPSDAFAVSEIELVYRSKVKASERPLISCSEDAYHIFLNCWEEGKIGLLEQFKVLYLNRANRVLAVYQAFSGGLTSTIADPRLIMVAGLKVSSVSLLLCHYV